MNARWRGLTAAALICLAGGPAAAFDLQVADFYRTDGYIHRLEVADGYVAWIESPEDILGGGEVEPSPLDLYVSDGTQVTRVSTDRMRPVLPTQFATQLGAVAWYARGPDLPTDDIYAVLYSGGVNTVVRQAAPAGGLPIGNQELKPALELPMAVFALMDLIEGRYYQHIYAFENGRLRALSLPEYPGIHNFSPGIDSRRVVWGVEVLLPQGGSEYLISLWEGGVLVDLTPATTYPVANVQADGRLVVWSRTDSIPWQLSDVSSEVIFWDEVAVWRFYDEEGPFFDGRPHLNRRQIAWRTEYKEDRMKPVSGITCFSETRFFEFPYLVGWLGDPVVSEDFLAYTFRLWDVATLELTSTELSISGRYQTDTPYDEYMPRADFPYVVWVRDEGCSRVLVAGQPAVSVDLELVLNQTYFHPGDRFLLETEITSNVTPLITDLYVVLEAAGQYFFWPSWTGSPAGRMTILDDTEPLRETILDFTWPQVDDFMLGLHFHGALVWHATFVLLDYDLATFGFGP